MIILKGRPLRQKRVRAKIKGTLQVPRINIFRSNQRFYGSLINDALGETLAAVSDKEAKIGKGKTNTKTEKAYKVGVLLGEKAKKKKIKKVVFDRAGYKYHGRVRAFAEGARSEGLEF